MREIELPPDPFLLESMRSVGYSFETAVADVIDNSISANARTVHLLSSKQGPQRVSIFDDGDGMDSGEAVHAMQLAATSPSETRRESDLGRFGLGLKTASLSQCRQLTIATKKNAVLTLLRWDLDYVIESGRWLVLEPSEEEAHSLLGWNLLDDVRHGTLICWEDLDLLTRTEGGEQANFDSAVARVRDHCSLVFHRFVSGIDARKVRMTVNGNDFDVFDPFLTKNRSTDVRTEDLKLEGQTLPVVAYTLPFINKLTPAERRLALAPGAFRDSQGFYVYRGGRLVVWGTWFRLNPKSELGKLARVRVDVPNSLDHLWVLDIKKSSASPPRELREALKNLALQFVKPSTQVHRYRGRRSKNEDGLVRLWDVVVDRDSFRYEVNREHPIVRGFADSIPIESLANLEALIEGLEQTFPILDAHNRLSQDSVAGSGDHDLAAAVRHAVALRPMFAQSHPDDESYLTLLATVEPYCQVQGFSAALRVALAATESSTS